MIGSILLILFDLLVLLGIWKAGDIAYTWRHDWSQARHLWTSEKKKPPNDE